MTDREMLELAAKAAGIEHGADRLECGLSLTERDGRHRSLPRWNPLDDDGDALRLATKLHFDVFVINDKLVKVKAPRISNMFSSSGGNDVNMLARRAIVQAAAEIGKIMNYQSDSN